MFLKKHQSVETTDCYFLFLLPSNPAGASQPRHAGGANRDRTGDLLLAKQALSQLSYGPVGGGSSGGSGWSRTIDPRLIKTVL